MASRFKVDLEQWLNEMVSDDIGACYWPAPGHSLAMEFHNEPYARVFHHVKEKEVKAYTVVIYDGPDEGAQARIAQPLIGDEKLAVYKTRLDQQKIAIDPELHTSTLVRPSIKHPCPPRTHIWTRNGQW